MKEHLEKAHFITFLATYLSAQQVCSFSEMETKNHSNTGEVQYALWLLHSSSEVTLGVPSW